MYQEGFDLTTSQIHSMRVYGRGWETDGEGLPFRTLEGSGFGPGHRLDIRFESFITNKTTGDTHAHTRARGGGVWDYSRERKCFYLPVNRTHSPSFQQGRKTVPFQAK